MDPLEMRTLFLGLGIGLALYLAGFAVDWLFDGPNVAWWSFGLTLASMVVTIGWFFAVKRGFRLGKAPNRGERRAKEHAKAEREKKQRMSR